MPAERTVMRQVREVLRLKFVGGVPIRAIARRIGIAASTVRATINRFQAAGLSWPLPADMTDAVLEAMLYADAGGKQGYRRQIEPDWSTIHRELKRKHVTLSLLWQEYIERNPQGYRYSRFCELYRSWEGRLSLTMRQTHVGGDKLFVDYAGDTVPVVIDRLTGETREAQIFVAVMGASNFTYVEATWTQGLADWIGAHTRAFAAIGGVPCLVVPDNAKVAIIKAYLYEPQVNRTYAEMAAHYGTAVLPTRPRRPRDKAKVETAVLIIERWILARLRHQRFYSLAELNAAIGELLKRLNDERVIRRLGRTRRQLLEELDWPAIKPLPSEPYVFAEWRVRRVGIDYHVEVERHFYSVPFRFAPPSQYPRRPLLPLGDQPCLPIQPSTCFINSASRAWPKPSARSKHPRKPQRSLIPNGSLCCSIRRSVIAATGACLHACAMRGCAIKPQSRISTTAPRAVSIALYSKNSPQVTGSMCMRI